MCFPVRLSAAPCLILAAASLAAISSLPVAAAQSRATPQHGAPPDIYRDEPLVFEHLDTTVRMHADGTGERLQHIVVRVQSEGAARQFSVLSVSYASAYETGAFDFVRVHKPDASVIETPTSAAIDLPAPVTREAPLYSDLKESQLPVRSLAAGDTIEYQLHTRRSKAEAPGQFWGAEHFVAAGSVVLSQTLTLEVPSGAYVKLWSPNHPSSPTEHDGTKQWRWESSQTRASGRDKDGKPTSTPAEVHDPDQDPDGRNLPSVAWTTFHSWAEVGDWYRGLALPRAQPDASVRAKADDLTRDAKSPEDQVRALYQFVSTKTRYVGIDLGIGRYQPHAAAEVLSTQYGDCKDKDTLLEALLHAKGFATAPALIGVNITPVPELPSPAVFNHVITTVDLPTGRIWLDATPEVEPFRVLIPGIRDQQALVIPATGDAHLERTPAAPPFPYFERFDAAGTLGKDGLLKSHMTLTVRSDNEPGFRILVQRAAPSEWDQAMQLVSGAMGFGGAVSNVDLHQPDPSAPVHLTYDYSRPSFADWANGRILPLFPALEIAIIDKEKAPEHDIDQGAARTLEAHTRIHLPGGYRADLPDAIHVKQSFATFDQTYRLDAGELLVDRKAVILTGKVPKARWRDYIAFVKATGVETGENYIQLIPPAKALALVPADKGNAPAASRPSTAAQSSDPVASGPQAPADLTVQQLIDNARQSTATGDFAAARHTLEQARARDPQAPFLMSMLGFVALRENKIDEGISDLKAELGNHPDPNNQVILLLANAYVYNKQPGEAASLLKKYVGRDDVQLSLALADVQAKMQNHADAVTTLQTAAAAHPDDRPVASLLAMELVRVHRNTEAAAAARAAMDGSDEPGILNDNSYVLSEVKLDLPFAEKSTRHAIDLLEASSAQRTLAEANSKAFAEANLLAAAWDTLGWILFQQNKPAEAEPFLAAAWFNSSNLTVGHHLAKVREALGKPSEALTADELALATEHASDSTGEFAEVKSDIERLRKAGAHSSAGNTTQTLQEMRMFKLAKPAGVKGWGTFRVQLGQSGVFDSDLVTGSPAIRPINVALKKLTVAQALPPNSHAHLLRDAVVSCSSEQPDCQVVFMPHAGLNAEGVQ